MWGGVEGSTRILNADRLAGPGLPGVRGRWEPPAASRDGAERGWAQWNLRRGAACVA